MNKIEVLSPARDFECLKSAILYGADAIYLGGEIFGMRATAANFSEDLLYKSVEFAHSKNVKIYLTCNSIPTNEEVKKLKNFLKTAEEIGVDGLIIADIGVLFEAKKLKISIPFHISTQFGVVNYKTANALYELGARRIVLARELSLKEMASIKENIPKDLELECFVHGAACMSFSGRCLISSYLTKRDANRGQCAQPCRWKYYLVEEKRPNQYYPVFEDDFGSYILNCKDLCLIDYLDKLYEAGISSFKIEGRAKSSYYVGVTTNAYKMAVNMLKDSISSKIKYSVPKYVKDELLTISHREYHEGFLFNRPKSEGQFYESSEYLKQYYFVGTVLEVYDEKILVKQKNKFSVEDELEILIPKKQAFKFKVLYMFDENENEIFSASNSEMLVYLKIPKNHEILRGCLIRKICVD